MNHPTRANLSTMMQQSAYVLARPSVAAFERFERSGGAAQAFAYVTLVALVGGLIALIINLTGAPLWAFLERFLVVLAGFGTFSAAAHFFGRTQGGTGTFSEVAYTLSLSYVPIALFVTAGSVLLTISLVGLLVVPFWYLLGWAVQAFYAYIGMQGSLNVRTPGTIALVMGVSALSAWFVQLLVAWLI